MLQNVSSARIVREFIRRSMRHFVASWVANFRLFADIGIVHKSSIAAKGARKIQKGDHLVALLKSGPARTERPSTGKVRQDSYRMEPKHDPEVMNNIAFDMLSSPCGTCRANETEAFLGTGR